jgi:hypothetical protein
MYRYEHRRIVLDASFYAPRQNNGGPPTKIALFLQDEITYHTPQYFGSIELLVLRICRLDVSSAAAPFVSSGFDDTAG